MDKHVIKLSAIIRFFKEEEKLITRGENAIESGHVTNMVFDCGLKILKAKIHASMRDREYNVEIRFTSDWLIERAECSCPRGQYLCHHMAAVALCGHYNVSVTDKACSWIEKKPRKEEVKTVKDLYPPKMHRSTSRDVTQAEIEKLQEKLQVFDGAVGLTWLLSKEQPTEKSLLIDIEDILFSNEYATASSPKLYFQEKVKVSSDIINKVANATLGQSKNENWLICRKNRLTASNFGAVLSSSRRNRYSPSLFKRLAGTYNIDHIKAIQWGREHEKEAVEEFEIAEGVKVIPTGLWLHDCGFLGASPDGLIGEDAIIEVKCPFKYREISMMESIKHNCNYIIVSDNDGNITINKNHEYYQQIQGQLAVTKRKTCHLVVWTPKEVVIIGVQAEDFSKNIDILQNFHKKVIKRSLISALQLVLFVCICSIIYL